MKVAILFLFAFVAVSQAAFTVNLVQRAQPVLAKTFIQARMQLRVRSDEGLQTTLFQTLQEHANTLLEQIQTSIANGVEVAQNVYDSFFATVEELQNLGSNAIDAVTSILGNFFGGLFGGSKRALDLSVITQVLQGLGLDDILGGLFSHVASLIAQLEIPAFIEGALSAILSNDVVQQILSALFGRSRGFFGDLINNLTAAAQNLASQVAGFVSQIQDTLAAGLSSVAQIAQQIITDAQSQIGTITEQAANQLIEALAPFANDLGVIYEQAVAAINSLIGNKH